MKDFKTTYFFLRLPIAISLLGHGLVRLPKLATFSNWMVTSMEKSMIPDFLIVPFSYILPIAEFLIGLSLVIGFKTKYTIFSGLILMSILILGSSSIENWSAIESQLLHSVYLFGLYWFWNKNQSETTH
ncbi:DoxX family membrane protein [Epilithonimonas ginsengisoli]|uniref:DoxX family membrane protein n=1 Tax=Epilithonimonas ginsengisoli TaxID=1245592 RepID=A0ABU4JLV6_9FLAO|nr:MULTISPECIES: DoxX family membrane protein [Chryseobacterium group]MBV6881653.1 DoxX family membrane protein [Epilithonimonas sp. FP105]MDW8550661.1 DoxX family membrane protein [Epilithonimonas ginsengisoli]OAH70942.1 DoxX family protein [Chryseobacterium sp. FP211-J200]